MSNRRVSFGLIVFWQDAVNASIEIQLFHMKREGKPFDADKYYRAILTGSGDDYNDQVAMLRKS